MIVVVVVAVVVAVVAVVAVVGAVKVGLNVGFEVWCRCIGQVAHYAVAAPCRWCTHRCVVRKTVPVDLVFKLGTPGPEALM